MTGACCFCLVPLAGMSAPSSARFPSSPPPDWDVRPVICQVTFSPLWLGCLPRHPSGILAICVCQVSPCLGCLPRRLSGLAGTLGPISFRPAQEEGLQVPPPCERWFLKPRQDVRGAVRRVKTTQKYKGREKGRPRRRPAVFLVFELLS